ncbi:MAG: SprB repeat-containing protein, partial [Bacteroidetes bacterium]|nr:SprB repeat-containing protein [Bacteroidota bacterium]
MNGFLVQKRWIGLIIFLLFILIPSLSKATTYYWVGGSGYWHQGAHWSLTSGGVGVGGTNVVTQNDNVIFNDQSFSAINQEVRVNNANIYCHDMVWQNVPNGTLFDFGCPLTISGSLEYASNMNLNNYNGTTSFISDDANEYIKSGGIQNVIKSVTFNGNGVWTLQDYFNIDNDISFDKGTLLTSSNGIKCGKFISVPSDLSNPREINLGNTEWTVKYSNNTPYLSWNANNDLHSLLIITGGSSLIDFLGIGQEPLSTMHAGDDLRYDNIVFESNGLLQVQIDTIHDVTFHGNGEIIGDSTIFHDALFYQYGRINGNNNDFHNVTIEGDGDIGNYSLPPTNRNVDNNTFNVVDIYVQGRVYGNYNVFYDLLFSTHPIHGYCFYPYFSYFGNLDNGELHGNHCQVTDNLVFHREGKIFGTLNFFQHATFWCDGWILDGSNSFYNISLYRHFQECYGYLISWSYPIETHRNVLTLQHDSVQHLQNQFYLLGNIYCGHTLIRSTSANTPAYFNSDSVLTLDYIELLYIHSANPQNVPDTAVRSLDDGGNYFWNFHLVYTAIEKGSTTTSPVHPCFGDGSGEITFNPQGGVPPYEYSILDWNNIFHIFTSWTPFQTSNV